ncbi:hypothetical protein NARC_40151 [Candidatus Nitrosocosmicus arcticus]|uniref:Uncharacterized protein n=1 Tax=Candidatus Nitrosocosmicus arcticus TaxID=2035267 RepID=A0A557SX52_9ARCH|nr:hypothetical protein NARC_40151 [Candidatus Nitrosocosmicus arcticus]
MCFNNVFKGDREFNRVVESMKNGKVLALDSIHSFIGKTKKLFK